MLTNSCGLDPDRLSRSEKLLYLFRGVPLVKANVNPVELARREIGNTYLYPLRLQAKERATAGQGRQQRYAAIETPRPTPGGALVARTYPHT